MESTCLICFTSIFPLWLSSPPGTFSPEIVQFTEFTGKSEIMLTVAVLGEFPPGRQTLIPLEYGAPSTVEIKTFADPSFFVVYFEIIFPSTPLTESSGVPAAMADRRKVPPKFSEEV